MSRPVRILSGTTLVILGLYALILAARQYARYSGSLDADLWEWPLLLGLGLVTLGWSLLRWPNWPKSTATDAREREEREFMRRTFPHLQGRHPRRDDQRDS